VFGFGQYFLAFVHHLSVAIATAQGDGTNTVQIVLGYSGASCFTQETN
jgi:hypothetical protein